MKTDLFSPLPLALLAGSLIVLFHGVRLLRTEFERRLPASVDTTNPPHVTVAATA